MLVNRSSLGRALVIVMLGSSFVRAQFPSPNLSAIFPCGARQGTTVECTILGGELTGATGLYFSHPGITAELVDEKTYKVTVARDVPIGRYDVRVVCPAGVSTCRSFVVGDRPEFVEDEKKSPNNDRTTAQPVTLPCVCNGLISGNIDLDHYTFAAKQGQRVIVNCWAWRFDSRLDATLAVYDSAGKEIAYNGDYFGKDAFIDFTAPADGDYTVKVWDFVYGGGGDMTYRLEIGSLPHLDAIMPPVVVPGEPATVTLFGRNLPGGRPAPAEMQVQGRPLEMLVTEVKLVADPTSIHAGEVVRPAQALLDGREFRLTTPGGASNGLFVGFTTLPTAPEIEPNGSVEAAQRLAVPSETTGMFSPVGDVDYYAFAAKKGEKVIVEIFGERLSGLADPLISGFDAKGKRLTSGDDGGPNIGQLRFTTNTRDARWDFDPPADGEYFIQVRDLYYQQRGDPRFTYRLSVRLPTPDFRLVAVGTLGTQPEATVLRRNGKYWLDILALRKDGFDGPITVTAEGLPPGVVCEPVVVAGAKTSVPLVFEVATDAPLGQAAIRIVGRAKIGEVDSVRTARGGTVIFGTANTPTTARMSDEVVVAVREAAPFAIQAKPAKRQITAGETLPIQVELVRAADWSDDVQLSGFDLPQNATLPLVTINKGAMSGTVELSLPANTKPGPYTFVIHGSGQMPRNYPAERDPKKWDKNLRGLLPSNPITIEVLAGEAKK
jgi:hypothetical protein